MARATASMFAGYSMQPLSVALMATVSVSVSVLVLSKPPTTAIVSPMRRWAVTTVTAATVAIERANTGPASALKFTWPSTAAAW